MSSRALSCAALLAVLAGLATSALASKSEPKLLLLETQSRIEIDAQGKVTAVKTTPDLPADIGKIVDDNVRKLRFQPPMKDGRAVSGVTYVVQDACAAPVDGSYRFAVKYRGNGPGIDQNLLPSYPHEAQTAGVESKWAVEYQISPDGKGRVTKLERTQGGGGRLDAAFRASIVRWAGAMKFQPELLDGQPVATRDSNVVEFVLGPSKEIDLEHADSDACQLALKQRDEAPRAVALDSPFKLLAAQD
jgi:hypothetical protein